MLLTFASMLSKKNAYAAILDTGVFCFLNTPEKYDDMLCMSNKITGNCSPLEQFELFAAAAATARTATESLLGGGLALGLQVILPLAFLSLLPLAVCAQEFLLFPVSWARQLGESALLGFGAFLEQNAALGHQGYLVLLGEMALLLLISNLGGLLPYGFTLTAQMVITF